VCSSDLPEGREQLVATGIPGVDKLLATFRPTGLAAGDYVLRVGITDPSTGHKEINAISFQVIDREGS